MTVEVFRLLYGKLSVRLNNREVALIDSRPDERALASLLRKVSEEVEKECLDSALKSLSQPKRMSEPGRAKPLLVRSTSSPRR